MHPVPSRCFTETFLSSAQLWMINEMNTGIRGAQFAAIKAGAAAVLQDEYTATALPADIAKVVLDEYVRASIVATSQNGSVKMPDLGLLSGNGFQIGIDIAFGFFDHVSRMGAMVHADFKINVKLIRRVGNQTSSKALGTVFGYMKHDWYSPPDQITAIGQVPKTWQNTIVISDIEVEPAFGPLPGWHLLIQFAVSELARNERWRGVFGYNAPREIQGWLNPAALTLEAPVAPGEAATILRDGLLTVDPENFSAQVNTMLSTVCHPNCRIAFLAPKASYAEPWKSPMTNGGPGQRSFAVTAAHVFRNQLGIGMENMDDMAAIGKIAESLLGQNIFMMDTSCVIPVGVMHMPNLDVSLGRAFAYTTIANLRGNVAPTIVQTFGTSEDARNRNPAALFDLRYGIVCAAIPQGRPVIQDTARLVYVSPETVNTISAALGSIGVQIGTVSGAESLLNTDTQGRLNMGYGVAPRAVPLHGMATNAVPQGNNRGAGMYW
jgi:hypothetical protein